jgi:hypothetical protein
VPGRVRLYDGANVHWLTRIEEGNRWLLILYSARGRWGR